MNRKKFVWRLMPLMAALAFLLTGCGDPTLSALDPKGPVAQEQLFLMKLSLGVMIFVFTVVMALYIYVLIRYRKRKGQEGVPKQVEGSHVLEVVWTVIPIILLIIIAVPTVYYTFKHSENYTENENILQVKVTAHQYWWQFEYPQHGINTAQDLVIPVGQPVAFEVVASDVIHSFWVPSLGGKIDTLVGQTNVTYLQADEPAVYRGKCAELCGASHALMDFKVVAMEQADFDAWVSNIQSPPAVPDSVAQGEEVFRTNCLSCHAVGADGMSMGPNLTGFADREMIAGILEHTDENLKNWISDTQSIKPGNKMPSFNLSDEQMNQLVDYLNELKLQ
ncbi:cytochrome c oxidase subunit II [Paenibacillus senegalensis]|uniref:cytochrome c oxidase subunit II n=1 Tax=Paenibacillus senegalensis TaxID=1465766 RepID=UPI000289385A|nr:cytochrome c oxidase subunit II [Paenibacillus senegalensis]